MSRHVVVGAGSVGSALARLLAERGEEVVVLTRTGSGPEHPAVRLITGDASSAEVVMAASRGAGVLYNCANPPYHHWPTAWPPIAAALLAAAQAEGAVLATVSNLYGYGPVDRPMTEDLPLAATGAKARTRVEMWRQAIAAHEAGRVRVTEVRGSDYLCPGAQSHLGDRVMPRLLAGKGVRVLPGADTAHTWTSPEDVAALLAVVGSDERAWGKAWHVPSEAPRSQREAIAELAGAAGIGRVDVAEIAPALLRVLGLFMPIMRELPEVAYQLDGDFVLDSSAAQSTFGLAPTPWARQLERQVEAYRG